LLIEEVSKLYPTEVKGVFIPKTIEELQCFLKDNNEDISIGGARFSMGGQIAHPETIHVDMRHLNKIKNLNIEDKTIIVEAGICWIDIIKEIDKSNLSIKVMQTYSNFTVSGALSVNAHGRYVGYGSIISTLEFIRNKRNNK
jgi:FAD/FMN-containing dehydrogenase